LEAGAFAPAVPPQLTGVNLRGEGGFSRRGRWSFNWLLAEPRATLTVVLDVRIKVKFPNNEKIRDDAVTVN
jgi:hypothetical protein